MLLEILEISDCHGLKQIVTELEDDEGEISSSVDPHDSLCFPKLRELYIVKCDGLEYIFPALMAPQELPELENLPIHDCPQLKQVVRCNEGRDAPRPVQFPKPLTEFSVSACPLLTDSFVHLKDEKAILKKVRLLTFKDSFHNSKHLQLSEAIEDYNLVQDANGGLNGLTSLELKHCKDIKCLVDTTTGNEPTSAFTKLESFK
ncbi:hypothetical protein ERO13_D10G233800v2 [Gossypium hirsutum]|uniref:Disease resistance protein At4g27190-like leucine-rich repeats domain-containing protein n=1 Tax=Gossypium mustelinum TaxID=34275 RepID=A0A5D2TEY8_GOSMU|nr:hypothetical protein ERO13_D10G233800v2 [Gossypium hirsutum]TYI62784.1 hypothetical protein E1A91_D10G271800v1 [Gossypium mustelinum]